MSLTLSLVQSISSASVVNSIPTPSSLCLRTYFLFLSLVASLYIVPVHGLRRTRRPSCTRTRKSILDYLCAAVLNRHVLCQRFAYRIGQMESIVRLLFGTSSYVCHAHMGSDGASERNESVSTVDEGGVDVCTFGRYDPSDPCYHCCCYSMKDK